FTQRGEIAVADKYTRAIHAVNAGADIVFELPTVFATAPAEIFASGAISIINCLNGQKSLCFGSESATKPKLIATAKALLDESRTFKKLFKEELKSGVTQVRAKVNALSKMNIENLDLELLKSPNNILAVEYAKAVISQEADIDLFPVIREGTGYNDTEIQGELPSALAIRKALYGKDLKSVRKALPDFVYDDLSFTPPNADDLIFYSALSTPKSEMRKITDCTEGLENRIKAFAKTSKTLEELKDKLKTKRYTYSRISRILTSCLLKTDDALVRRCLNNPLYFKVLALDKDRTDVLSYFNDNSKIPVLTRKSDCVALSGTALTCFEKDVFAVDLYNFIAKTHSNEYEMKFVEKIK
ncbi:MAG: nucleotidyltransferase family protein, partial [Clostridia bacterium]|nr:nucleotidyltransferase family protein [Clostridia bacterium]